MSEIAKGTVLLKQNGRKLKIVPLTAGSAQRLAAAESVVRNAQVRNFDGLGILGISPSMGRPDFDIQSIDLLTVAAMQWNKSPLKTLFDAHGIYCRWDAQLVSYLRGRRKWLRRHMLDYKAEQLVGSTEYKQPITVEGQYRKLLEKFERELDQRPWSGKLADYQFDDVSRVLLKDRVYVGHKQGLGKTWIYGAVLDVLNTQRERSLAGQGKQSSKPFSLIVCESKAVWDVRDMFRTLLGVEAKILEKRGDENDPSFIHIIGYDKLCYGTEKWEPIEHCGLVTNTQAKCRKCKYILRTSVKEITCAECLLIHKERTCPRCAEKYRPSIRWADRDREVAMFKSGSRTHGEETDFNPRVRISQQEDYRDAADYPAGLVYRKRPWVKRLAKRYSVVIVDESDQLKSATAIRTKSIMQLRPKRRRIIGTGTLLDGLITDAFSQFVWAFGQNNPLMPFDGQNRTVFEDRFCKYVYKHTGLVRSANRVLVNRSNDEAMKQWYRLLYPKMVRQTDTAEVSAQMNMPPAPLHRLVEIAMDDADRVHYSYFLSEFVNRFRQLKQESEATGVPVSQMAVQSKMWALRMATAAPQSAKAQLFRRYDREVCSKQRMMVSLVQDYMAEGERVVIFSGVVDACQEAAKVLAKYGIGSTVLTGETPPAQRQVLIDEWKKNPEIPVLICSISAEKRARTFIEANHCIFLDMEWSPKDIEQAWKRVHRFGQTKQVTVDYLCCTGTIDQIIYETVLQKQQATNMAMDRKNATDYVHSRLDALELAMRVMASTQFFENELRAIRNVDFEFIEDSLDDDVQVKAYVRTAQKEVL